MKIDSNSEGKITVALSNEDMNELDITYDELDYSNIETRRVIWTLLDKAGQQLGKTQPPSLRGAASIRSLLSVSMHLPNC